MALALVAAIGDVHRFSSPIKLVGYLGLAPRVRQSGGRPASHGPITKQGRVHTRGTLVEAAWAAVKAPGPLRACYQRIRARRGAQIAAVAIARKLTVLASPYAGRRLCLRTPLVDGQQAAHPGTPRWPPRAPRAEGDDLCI